MDVKVQIITCENLGQLGLFWSNPSFVCQKQIGSD